MGCRTQNIPTCKWCKNPVKKYFNPKGEFKSYLKTCGSEECLKASYHDNAVNARKSWKGKRKCEKCGNEYLSLSRSQKWCKECVPSKASRAIIKRYDISYPEYMELLKVNLTCQICERPLIKPVIDHNHKTGQIRGMICFHCNSALNIIENKVKLERALNYLNKYHALQK